MITLNLYPFLCTLLNDGLAKCITIGIIIVVPVCHVSIQTMTYKSTALFLRFSPTSKQADYLTTLTIAIINTENNISKLFKQTKK